MLVRKLALIPAALFALGLIVAAPAESFAQSSPKPAATQKKDAKKKDTTTKKKAPAKKKAA